MKFFTPYLLISLFLINLAATSCNVFDSTPDLQEIQERDTLRAVTGYNPVSYFIYRGEPMGYDYELLNRLAENLDLRLDVQVSNSIEGMMALLNDKKADLIAYNLTITEERSGRVNFTVPLNETREVLVQKKPDNWRHLSRGALEETIVRDSSELAGDTIVVRRGSAFVNTLKELSSAIEGEIHIAEADPEITTEQLIQRVADGEIKFTVADENIALINQSYLPVLDVETSLSQSRQIAWAVNHGAENLLDTVNKWIDSERGTTEFNVIYNKYFKNRRAFRSRAASDLLLTFGGQLSPYDDLIRQYAEEINWDWRLLAALIYQESRFNPNAQSWSGARGLMQLMPRTAREYGAQNVTNPEQNIRAGTGLIEWLQNYWKDKIEDPFERQKFVLASYNVGQGHVQDARRLAEKHGANPDVWNGNVEEYMLKKAEEQYYTDEVVRHGYARGSEPVKYVNSIYYIYQHYQKGVDMAMAMAE